MKVIIKHTGGTSLINITNHYNILRTGTTAITFYPNGSSSYILNFASEEDTVTALKSIDDRLNVPYVASIP